MDLKQIEYFLAVVDHGGIAGAALTLGVAQPTISTGIRSLERALGVPLFHRLGRGMVLSSAGRALLGPGRQILRDTAAAKYNLASTSASLVGRLDIMAMPMLGLTALAEAIAAFRALHPRVIVHIKEFRDDTAPVELIRDGHCEFVASHIPLPEAEALQSLTLTVHEYWLAYPPGTVLPPGPVPLAVLPGSRWSGCRTTVPSSPDGSSTRSRRSVRRRRAPRWSSTASPGFRSSSRESVAPWSNGRPPSRWPSRRSCGPSRRR